MDELLGRIGSPFLWCLCKFSPKANPTHVSNILVIKFWGIGSVTLSMPLLGQIREQFPRARIHYLTLEQNEGLCRCIPDIDNVLTVSIESLFRFIASYYAVVVQVRKLNIDVVFDLEFFAYASAIVGAFTFAQRRKGFVHAHRRHDYRKLLYTDCVQFLETSHTSKNFLNLLSDAPALSFSGFKHIPQFPDIRKKEFRVVMNINASPLAYERRWGSENFILLTDFLTRNFDIQIYLTGSDTESEYVNTFAAELTNPNSVTNLVGKLSIEELLSLLQSSQLLVTNDSGPLHLASALNIPTVCFFGPEAPVRYGSLADKSLIFYKGLWCSPCMTVSNLKTVNCINNRECMKQITIEEVIDRIVPFMLGLGIERVHGERSTELLSHER